MMLIFEQLLSRIRVSKKLTDLRQISLQIPGSGPDSNFLILMADQLSSDQDLLCIRTGSVQPLIHLGIVVAAEAANHCLCRSGSPAALGFGFHDLFIQYQVPVIHDHIHHPVKLFFHHPVFVRFLLALSTRISAWKFITFTCYECS